MESAMFHRTPLQARTSRCQECHCRLAEPRLWCVACERQIAQRLRRYERMMAESQTWWETVEDLAAGSDDLVLEVLPGFQQGFQQGWGSAVARLRERLPRWFRLSE